MKNVITLLSLISLSLISDVFSYPAFADPGFQSIVNVSLPMGEAPRVVCGPNEEVHALVISSTDSVSVYSKKIGDSSWGTSKFLGAAYDTGSRKLPVIKISSDGYGCVIGQSFNQTYISYKTPLAGWTTAVKLGDIPTPFNSTNFESFDCAVNNKGEVLAVWRDDNNLKESFKGAAQNTFTTVVLKTGLKTATDKINDFQLVLTEASVARLFYLAYSASGDTGLSMTRSGAGSWTDDGEFAPLRAGRYFMGDLDYDSSTGKAILGLYNDSNGGNFSGAGYYYSIFDLSAKPQFALVGATSSTSSTVGLSLSGRTVGAQFQTAFAYLTTSGQAATATVKVNNVNTEINSITQEADSKVAWYLSDAEAVYTGAHSVVALSSKARTKQDPNNSQGLESFSYELKGTVIKNGVRTDKVLLAGDQSTSSDVATGFSPSVAGCASGSAVAVFYSPEFEFASVDYVNDSGTNFIPTPTTGGPDPVVTPGGPGTSVSDNCPNDINKLNAGICGCGVAEVDSNTDTIIDCGSPRAFVKNIVPIIASATATAKGKLNVQIEGLSGSKLKYIISVKGPKGYKKDFTAKKFLTELKKLPAGTLSLQLKVSQKQGKKTIKSKSSVALKVNVS